MNDTSLIRDWDEIVKTAAQAIGVGDLHQLADGWPASYTGEIAATTGTRTVWRESGQYTLPKTVGIVLLNGGPAYWDRSARLVHYKKVNDQDYLLGSIVGDAASAATTCAVNIGRMPRYEVDLLRDSFRSALIGTLALGGCGLWQRGGALKLQLDATNQAQKIDALSKDGFSNIAHAIVEFAVEVVNGSAGASPKLSIGLASGTHATNASAIAQRLFMHIDGNAAKINFESADGTTTVAITDSLQTYTTGTRFEIWIDCRDPTSVKFYVNGVQVLSGTTFNINAAASTWLLLAHLVKAAATDTCEIDIDWARVRIAEQL